MPQQAKVVSRSRSGVGESPVWSVAEARLYWVDITGRMIRALDPETGEEAAWEMPEIVTSVGLCRDGGLIAGLRKRVCLLRPGEPPETLAEIELDRPGNRLNEGGVAPDGSYWVGTMQDNIAADGSAREVDARTGALWRVAPDGTVTRLGPNDLGIANLMVWDADRFVSADTLAGALYEQVWDGATLGPRRALPVDGAPGAPDGGTLDAGSGLWNARFGGRCLLRLAGDQARIVDLPCTNPTSCAFGGPDLATLFVTSATFGLTREALAANPVEGALLAIRPDVFGRPPNLFG